MSSYDAWYGRIIASTVDGAYDAHLFRDLDVALAVADALAESEYAEGVGLCAVAVIAMGGEYYRLATTSSASVALAWQKEPDMVMTRAAGNSYMMHGDRRAKRLFDLYWPAAQALDEMLGGNPEDALCAWLRIRQDEEASK